MNEMNNNQMEVMDNNEVKAGNRLDAKSFVAGVITTLAVQGAIFGVKFCVTAVKNKKGKNKNVDTEVKVEEVKAEVVEK